MNNSFQCSLINVPILRLDLGLGNGEWGGKWKMRTHGLAFRKFAFVLGALQCKSIREQCKALSGGVLNWLLPRVLEMRINWGWNNSKKLQGRGRA